MSFFIYDVECEICHQKYQKTGGVVGMTSVDDGRVKCDCGGNLKVIKEDTPNEKEG